jgi:hypothetical protein
MVRNQALACNTRRENGVTVISRGNSGSRTRPRRTDPSGATTCRTTAPSGAPRSWTVMFVSDPSALVRNPAFRTKMVLVLLAASNAAAFNLGAFQRLRVAAPGRPVPAGAKAVAAASLLLWVAVVVCGRLIAYV